MQLTGNVLGNVQGTLDFVGGVQDVKVDGVSVVDDESVANITLHEAGVQDVEVDGVSVVNENGVAEITLPEAPVQDVIVDGVSVVNDQGIAEINIPDSGDNYSTTERVIGKWIDGNPIYEKTFEITAQNIYTSATVINGLTIPDYKHIISCQAISTDYPQASPLMLFFNQGQWKGFSIGGINVNKLVIQYTKTTDET